LTTVYLKPSFEELRSLAFKLFRAIERSNWKQDVNIGIGRGGLFVLRALQDFYIAKGLRIPYTVIAVERYKGIKRAGKVRIKYLYSRFVRNRKVLLIDDVADQGISLKEAERACYEKGAKEVKTATVHLKPWSIIKPDFYVAETDAWIIYPWEVYETIKLILEKRKGHRPKEIYWELEARANITPEEFERFYEIVKDSKLSERFKGLVKAVRNEFMKRAP
jgi:hypothetical protein